jgi:hypothetical protein
MARTRTRTAVAKKPAANKKPTQTGDDKAKHTALLQELAPIAKDINVRFQKAAKLDGDAQDHRLAAALQLAEAKKKCEAQKMAFKEWVERNITEMGYHNCRKLVQVGESKNPALAIEDLRLKNAEANKKARAKSKASSKSTKAAPLLSNQKGAPDIIREQVATLPDGAQVDVARGIVKEHGFAVVSEAEASLINEAVDAKKAPAIERAKKAFSVMTAKDKMTLLTWAAAEVGTTLGGVEAVVLAPEARAKKVEADDGDLTPPQFLQDAAKKSSRKKK